MLFTRSCWTRRARLVDVLVLSPLVGAPDIRAAASGLGPGPRTGSSRCCHPSRAAGVPRGSPGLLSPLRLRAGRGLGFRRPSLRIPEPAFMVYPLPSYEAWMTGTLVYAEEFWRHDCVGLRELQRDMAPPGPSRAETLVSPRMGRRWPLTPGGRVTTRAEDRVCSGSQAATISSCGIVCVDRELVVQLAEVDRDHDGRRGTPTPFAASSSCSTRPGRAAGRRGRRSRAASVIRVAYQCSNRRGARGRLGPVELRASKVSCGLRVRYVAAAPAVRGELVPPATSAPPDAIAGRCGR